MLATTGAYAAMAESQEQFPDYRITITLPAAGAAYDDVTLGVEKFSVDMSTVSDVPDQSRYQVGYTAAECTFTLAGLVDQRDESFTAAWLFGKYPTPASDGSISPLYRTFIEMSPVTVDLGLEPAGVAGVTEFLRKFTGYISDYTENPDGSVDFTCIDSRVLFKSAVTTLPVITAPPYNSGLTSEFAVDMLCRTATAGKVSSWPAQRPGCVLGAGMRASLWPEVGTLNTTVSVPPPIFAPGVMGSTLAGSATLNQVIYSLAAPLGDDVIIEFWATATCPTIIVGDVTNNFMLTASLSPTNAITVQSTVAGVADFTATGLTISAPCRVRALFHQAVGSTSWSVSLQLSTGGTYSSGTRTTASARTTAFTTADVLASTTGTCEALQITSETVMPANAAFTPQAVLDPSLNPLQVIPETSGDPWQVIQQIADAEFAVAGFDESGVFRFRNRQTIRSGGSVRTVTSTMALKSLAVESTTAAVINRAQIPYTTYKFATVASTVWSLDTATRIPRGQTVTITATVDSLFVSLDQTISVLANGSTDTTNSFYRASVDKAGTSQHPGVTFGSFTQTDATTLTFKVTNPTGSDAWLVSPSNFTDIPVGTPLLRLAAKAVTPANELVADFQYPPAASGGAASTRWGEVAYQPSSNPWLQDPDATLQLAQDLVVDSCVPRPNLTNVDIVPDPRLQLIDAIHLQDPDVTGVDEYARIFSWTITWEAQDSDTGVTTTYDQTLDARTLAAPGGWIMGVPGRSEIGSTAYVYPSV